MEASLTHDPIERLCPSTIRFCTLETTEILLDDQPSLIRDMKKLLLSEDNADVRFLVGQNKTPVLANSIVLQARSAAFCDIINETDVPDDTGCKRNVFKKNNIFGKMLRFAKKDKKNKLRGRRREILVPNIDENTFRIILEYLYTGTVRINILNAVDILNYADVLKLPELSRACFQFAKNRISVKTALPMLDSSCKHRDSSINVALQGDLLDFIAINGEAILKTPSITQLSKQTLFLIMSHENLHASEETKWNAALLWTRRYSSDKGKSNFQKMLKLFARRINFEKLPAAKFINEVLPLSILPLDVLKTIMYMHKELPNVKPTKK